MIVDNFIVSINYPAYENRDIPLICLCVSYNYFDTLKFMLPINYMHFEKMYIVTQEDDTETVEFCKKFENVELLFYNFTNNGKTFDKYGAMNCAQHIIYKKYPHHWYVNIDSDILLPNNFVDILKRKTLDKQCVYGILRVRVLKTSDLMNKNKLLSKHKVQIENNNCKEYDIRPIGYFQMYKKKIFQKSDYNNGAGGDRNFSKSFDKYEQIKDIFCLHLGPTSKNKDGKVAGFIEDINIDIKDIYFTIEKYTN